MDSPWHSYGQSMSELKEMKLNVKRGISQMFPLCSPSETKKPVIH